MPIRPHLLPALLAALVFIAMLGRRDIVTSHEARVIQVSRIMAQSGWPWNARPASVPPVKMVQRGEIKRLAPDLDAPPATVNPWLVPVLNDEIRLQKPPLPYWCTAALFRLAGRWSESASRLIPALLGALSTLLVASLARLTLGRRTMLPAALIWVSSYFIPDEFRKVMADPYLAFFTLAALWGWVRSARGRSGDPAAGHWPSTLVFYASLGLGMLAKGPPMLIHLAGPLVLDHVLRRRGLFGPLWAHLAGIALFAAIALPWPIYVLNRVPHAAELWRYESIGELGENTENARPWHYYVPLLFQISLPWTPLFVIAILLPFIRGRRPRGGAVDPGRQETQPAARSSPPALSASAASTLPRSRFFPLASYGLVVAFFSIVNLKKAAYLLPDMPFQTLMIAQAAAMMMAAIRRPGARPAASLVLAAQSLLAVGFSLALLPLVIRLGTAWPLALALCGIPTGLAALSLRSIPRPRRWLWQVATAQALAAFVFISFYLAPKDNLRSPKPVAALLMKELADPAASATIMPRNLPAEITVYLPLDVEFNPQARALYHVSDDPRGLRIRTAEYFQALYPNLRIIGIQPVEFPGSKTSRWKVFRLEILPQGILATVLTREKD